MDKELSSFTFGSNDNFPPSIYNNSCFFESTYSTAQSARGSSDGVRFQRVLALSNVKAPIFSFTSTSDYHFKIILQNVGECYRYQANVANTIL